MNAQTPTTNRNQADRAKQGVMVFSRLGQRDLFASGAIERVADGWRLMIRNPFYTGTFLSTLSLLEVAVNGHAVPADAVFIALRGQRIPAAFAKNCPEIWWGMGEAAEVLLADPTLDAVVTDTSTVDVSIDLRTTFSYGFPNDTLPYRLSGQLERLS